MPQLDILCHKTKPPVPGIGYILFSEGQRGLMDLFLSITDHCQDYGLLSIL